MYTVALNSYRGTGGGGHLTSGAGIPKEELLNRLTWSSERDLRYHLMEELRKQDTLLPLTERNWTIVPGDISGPASLFDRNVLD